MTQYMILILIIDGLVLIGMTIHGWHKGFVSLVSEAVSLIAAIWAVVLISGAAADWREGGGEDAWLGILFLLVLGVIYKILHRILSSIRWIAGLPVINWLDAVLGVLLGFCEGFAILYALEYLLRMYLLQ